jgi:hypothetical protein
MQNLFTPASFASKAFPQYFILFQEGMDRYRIEDKSIKDIAIEIRDMERLLSIQGREVTALDDLL